jgi:hypothetical protein
MPPNERGRPHERATSNVLRDEDKANMADVAVDARLLCTHAKSGRVVSS